MMDDMQLREQYKETYGEIHASETLGARVRGNLQQQKLAGKSGQIKWRRRLAGAVAAFLLLVVGSNGITYAATGDIWVKSLIVHLNGTEAENDSETLCGWIMGEKGPTAVKIIKGKEDDEDVVHNVIRQIITDGPEIIERNGRLYFMEGETVIDITEDAADGEVSGTYQAAGIVKQFHARYTEEAWELTISEMEED